MQNSIHSPDKVNKLKIPDNFSLSSQHLVNDLAISHHNSHFRVSCSGSKSSSSHPLIYLSLEGKSSVICPYCSKIFKKNPKH